ncbi:MAG: hypothetical protein Q8N56_00070, partial [bacterium]|nr:hypothetical protein [bacterium]
RMSNKNAVSFLLTAFVLGKNCFCLPSSDIHSGLKAPASAPRYPGTALAIMQMSLCPVGPFWRFGAAMV